MIFLLQMYGEKVEEAEELRLDLADVKDMYKQQIQELVQAGSGGSSSEGSREQQQQQPQANHHQQ